MKDIELWLGDCLELMDNIPDSSIDTIITDLPYGTTACKWDTIIPFEPMWKQVKRVLKPDKAIALFGSEPFSSQLRMSNIDDYKYDWIWVKSRSLGFTHCKNKPMQKSENISIFSTGKIKHYGQKNRTPYFPQELVPYGKKVNGDKSCNADSEGHRFARPSNKTYIQEYTNYPVNILEFDNDGNTKHPTQKPILLMEYLIKTYTIEGETVLDITMGSGTTLLAAKNTNRKGIGIEKEKKYYDIAVEKLR